ncbi:hypothetical protein H6P81_020174 [Aristolochia fimbriata]|uniref:CWF19-like protein 2 n=1 Tax=Aristolochia fimbriata TaxID=158543 RepID=A0AAV7DUT7_ARIFI|nr:hypothetical protein H6P81_020174 [Aristolochia fimbriata]
MLSGVKFISRDQLNRTSDEDSQSEKRKKVCRKKRNKKKMTDYSSSESEELQMIPQNSSRNKKKYSSGSSSSGASDFDSEREQKSKMKKTRRQRRYSESSGYDDESKSVTRRLKKKVNKRRPERNSESLSSFDSEKEESTYFSRGNVHRKESKKWKKDQHEGRNDDFLVDGKEEDEDEGKRKGMGLEWMLKPSSKADTKREEPEEELLVDEVMEPNPRELNPYFKNRGSGYPEDETQTGASAGQLLPSSVVGDGGASWRLKALKRAREQAAREGRMFDEVVEERWGSLGQMTLSVASQRAAPARAHLGAIKGRKMGSKETCDEKMRKSSEGFRENHHEYLQDVSVQHPKMKEPKVHGSLSWGKKNRQNMSSERNQIISEAATSLNQFANDGSFTKEFSRRQKNDSDAEHGSSHISLEKIEQPDVPSSNSGISVVSKSVLTGNQLAAKVLQLRMKGKHEEAESLLKEAETVTVGDDAKDEPTGGVNANRNRHTGRDLPSHHRKMEDDADAHLARRIVQNKQYSLSGRADDEYDFDDVPSKKKKQKKEGASKQKSAERNIPTHILTQQERCQFCFENPTRPKHLIVSIAYFTYLMLPQWQPVVEGHCCILTKEHESATRSVDDNVWEEIRNFKKCLIGMFSKQEKDVLFLETVLELAKQRRHCMVECIPLPRGGAEEARIYFKKAIDEATGEWSQHNAKKLIPTDEKGLRASIPKDFPYFHVEFGLHRGYVHVIDDESRFKANLGLNVVRGMLGLPEEDMYRRRKRESVDIQKRAVASFAQEWEPFDWTKQL